MTVDNVLAVLGWYTVVSLGLLTVSVLSMTMAPNLVYRMQSLATSFGQDDMDVAICRFIGQYRLGVILLNPTPCVTSRIVY